MCSTHYYYRAASMYNNSLAIFKIGKVLTGLELHQEAKVYYELSSKIPQS